MTSNQRIAIAQLVVLFLVCNFMLWIGGSNYGEHHIPIFISIVAAEFLGAMLLGLFLQGWKR